MTKSRAVWAVCGLAVSLGAVSGCRVGPNYEQPKTETSESFAHTGTDGFDAKSVADPTRAPDAKWWGQFNDPMLDDLITRAAESNLDLKIAQARVREARAQRGVTASEWFPQVDVGAGYSRARGSENTAGARQGALAGGSPGDANDLYTAGFDAGWELDFFGRVARGVEAADADVQSAVETRRDVLVTLISEVARNYIELRGFQLRLAIARENITAQKETLELTKGRFAAGLTTDLDVAQAEASLAATESQVPALDQAVYASIHRISVLLGQRPEAMSTELLAVKSIPAPPDLVPVGLPSELLRRRPDIRRAERDVAASNARIGVATAELFPRFSIVGSFGLQSDKVADIGDASSRFWSIGPAVRWPILDWGRIRSNINIQDARTEAALAQYEKTVLIGFEEVENALVAYTREQARRKSLREAASSSRRAFDLSNQLYSNGLTDFQRVLDSQRAMLAADDAVADSDRAVSSNLIALYKALGGGWEGMEGVTAAELDAKAAQAPPASPTTPLPPPMSAIAQ